MSIQVLHCDSSSGSYPIYSGSDILEHAGSILLPHLHGRRIIIVTDENVAKLYLNLLTRSLTSSGYENEAVIIPAGESSKGLKGYGNLTQSILDHHPDRETAILALGGGVVGDLSGFAAATINRGIPWIQVPTTLMAQADSSIGGKTGINTPQGKNLIGAFHPPVCVISDTSLLQSLSDREYLSGYAEIAKIAVLDKAFFEWLVDHAQDIRDRNPEITTRAIERACKAKIDIVSQDEREQDHRVLLNLGHTFAHAIEACAGYDSAVTHGEAVSIGVVLAAETSNTLGLCEKSTVQSIRSHLENMGLPVSLNEISSWKSTDFTKHIRYDKKSRNGNPSLVLIRDIGDVFIASDIDTQNIFNGISIHLKEISLSDLD